MVSWYEKNALLLNSVTNEQPGFRPALVLSHRLFLFSLRVWQTLLFRAMKLFQLASVSTKLFSMDKEQYSLFVIE